MALARGKELKTQCLLLVLHLSLTIISSFQITVKPAALASLRYADGRGMHMHPSSITQIARTSGTSSKCNIRQFSTPTTTTLTTTTLYSKATKSRDKTKEWNTSLFPTPKVSPNKYKSIQPLMPPQQEFIPQAYVQTLAGMIGIVTGICVAGFKLCIEFIRQFCYGGDLNFIGAESEIVPYYLIPVLGALAVVVLSALGEFTPGLRGVVNETDEDSLSYGLRRDMAGGDMETAWSGEEGVDVGKALRPVRKALASAFTLGTGNSLGPEGPGVEIGAAISRFWMAVWPPDLLPDKDDSNSKEITADKIIERISRNRLLLACGAAAGVSSGFNAPLSGVFFALEVVQASLPPVSVPSPPQNSEGLSSMGKIELQQQSLSSNSGSITAILISSVLAALVARVFLGDELALQVLTADIQTPLSELPLYLLLGVSCGMVSVAFSQTAKLCKAILDGDAGPPIVRGTFGSLPATVLPIIGGLTCGGVGYFYPQVLFFGYETLNSLLSNETLPLDVLLTLLIAKTITTAVSAGSGLVGGTLAPSLFLGGMTGASFHNIISETFTNLHIDKTITTSSGVLFELAGVPIYSSIGAASVLAAIFRAPLTASLLLFEITRDYDVLLPLLASAGIASLVSDIVESKIESKV